jgi:UDP-N-acetylmuramoyl-L-alanyl-D-glutamate--2,6-diaminopimelate ligase
MGMSGYCVVPDRREAIELALRSARSGDAVLIAGKGHEDYQIVGTEKRPFDDRAEARRVLQDLAPAERTAPAPRGGRRTEE